VSRTTETKGGMGVLGKETTKKVEPNGSVFKRGKVGSCTCNATTVESEVDLSLSVQHDKTLSAGGPQRHA
jgi:hypothetical protein